jgi:Predicted membrane protein
MLAGAVFAGLVVAIARRSQSLSATGAIAALALGIACSAAGLSWAVLLVGFFVSATLISRFRRGLKERRTAEVVEKGGERDASQVLANGGVFTAAALASLIHPSPLWLCVGAGAIAASSADTWSTETGVLSNRPPRSIIDGHIVAAGESGGVTWLGTGGGILGALVIVFITILLGWGAAASFTALIGGFTGCLVDSALGATVQVQRWCDRCNRLTERVVHVCGTTTRVSGGLRWITNDAVNAVSTAAGAATGLFSYLLR